MFQINTEFAINIAKLTKYGYSITRIQDRVRYINSSTIQSSDTIIIFLMKTTVNIKNILCYQ